MAFNIDLDFNTFPSTLFNNTANGLAARQAVIDAAATWAQYIKDVFVTVPAAILRTILRNR
jgi:hypothetical protein